MRKESLTFYVKDLAKAVAWYMRELQRNPSYVVRDEACFHLDEMDLVLIREPAETVEYPQWSRPIQFSNFEFLSPNPSV